jgi:Proteasome stabiliser
VYGPQLLRGISSISTSGLKTFFPIMMKTLARWNFDYSSPGLRETLGLQDQDVATLAELFQNLLLFDGTSTSMPAPPSYISKEGFLNLSVLNAAKLAAVKLSRGALDKGGHIPLFIGARDGNSQVSAFCSDALKRVAINLEDESYIGGLYDLYFRGPKLTVQLGILESFSKSVLAANFPAIPKLIDQGFQGNPKSVSLIQGHYIQDYRTHTSPSCTG